MSEGRSLFVQLECTIEDGRWVEAIPDLEFFVRRVIHHAAEPGLMPGGGKLLLELSLLLVDDTAIQELNLEYRGKNKPTNVLSFPAEDFFSGEIDRPLLLGDIVMAYDTMAREAEEAGKPLRDHMAHLVIHGLLHLVGFDHEEETEAEEMEALEVRMLEELGITNPYQETVDK